MMNIEELNIREIGIWPLEYRLLAVILFGVLICFVLYYFLLKSSNNDLTTARNNFTSALNTFKSTYQEASGLEQYSKQIDQIKNMLNILLQNLPNKGELPALLEDISQQAISAGLSFELIKPEDPIEKGFYYEQPIKIILNGNYHGFGKFADGVTNLTRVVTLHDFSIDSNSQGKDNILHIESQAKTYWYNSDKEKI